MKHLLQDLSKQYEKWYRKKDDPLFVNNLRITLMEETIIKNQINIYAPNYILIDKQVGRKHHTVIHFVSITAKFGICTVMGLNLTLAEAEIRTSKFIKCVF